MFKKILLLLITVNVLIFFLPIGEKAYAQETCTVFFGDGPGEERQIQVGQNIWIIVSNVTTGDYLVRATNNTTGEIIERIRNASGAGLGALDFYLPISNAGTYTLGAYHKTSSGDIQCSGVLSVEATGGATPTPAPSPGSSPIPGEITTGLGTFRTDPQGFVQDILKIAFGIAGGIAFLLIIFGAIRILTSTGDPEAVNQGREIITSAIVGLLFIIFSVFILHLLGITVFEGMGIF